MEKFNFVNIKNFCCAQEDERHITDWVKTIVNHISNKLLLYRNYIELSKLKS